MIGKFFHTPKSKSFNIPYRFYDPEKDEMQAREERIKQELGIADEKKYDENYRANLRGTFRTAMGDHSKSVEDARKSSNVRLIILILVLSVAFYLLFYHKF